MSCRHGIPRNMSCHQCQFNHYQLMRRRSWLTWLCDNGGREQLLEIWRQVVVPLLPPTGPILLKHMRFPRYVARRLLALTRCCSKAVGLRLHGLLIELQAQLDEKHVVLHVDEAAKVWLAEKGYDVTMGARPGAVFPAPPMRLARNDRGHRSRNL